MAVNSALIPLTSFVSLHIGTGGNFLFYIDGYYAPGTFFPLGDEPVTLRFTSDSLYNYPGFRVEFYIGEGSPGKSVT